MHEFGYHIAITLGPFSVSRGMLLESREDHPNISRCLCFWSHKRTIYFLTIARHLLQHCSKKHEYGIQLLEGYSAAGLAPTGRTGFGPKWRNCIFLCTASRSRYGKKKSDVLKKHLKSVSSLEVFLVNLHDRPTPPVWWGSPARKHV